MEKPPILDTLKLAGLRLGAFVLGKLEQLDDALDVFGTDIDDTEPSLLRREE